MQRKRALAAAAFLLVLASTLAVAQGTVWYKIDGKPFSFKDARLKYYAADGYLSLDCERIETLTDSSSAGSFREVSVGMTIQLAGDETTFVGMHEASSPDEMPVCFSWYEIVAAKDKKLSEVKDYLASLDSGDVTRMLVRLKIDSFGPKGTIVRGSFSGKLFDEEGVLHTVSDGVFAVPKEDAVE